MRRIFSTVTKKVVIGYLVIVFFSLSALGYALFRLHQQTAQTEQLVNVDFRAFELVRDLQQNLLAQENIEKQLLILRDPALHDLRLNRNEELTRYTHLLNRRPFKELLAPLPGLMESYSSVDDQLSELLLWSHWGEAAELSGSKMVPLRGQLLKQLANMRHSQQLRINAGLAELSDKSSEAYRLTLLIALIGIGLSAPVSVTVVLSIHRSIGALKKATHEIAIGSFEHQPVLNSDDEFGQLATDFSRMGQKLRELEQLQLDANPLTRLPGNLAIDREVDHRISQQVVFSHLYIDLDNFKAYSDRYGYKAGSDVIAQVGDLIQQVVRKEGTPDDLIGHIGGDDYVVITIPDYGETLARSLIDGFTELVPGFYNQEDRLRGEFVGRDRFGVERTFPLMTISIAVINSDNYEYPSRLAISQDCARLKEYLKVQDGSNYMIDRRK